MTVLPVLTNTRPPNTWHMQYYRPDIEELVPIYQEASSLFPA